MRRKIEAININNESKKAFTKANREFENQVTFAYSTFINAIPKERLLILDNYAFDIKELEQLPEKDLFTNMHTHKEFSEAAKHILLLCPSLADKALNLLSQVIISKPIIQRIYDLGITLISCPDVKKIKEALDNFQLLIDSLNPIEKNEVLNFVIKMSIYDLKASVPIRSKITIGEVYSQVNKGGLSIKIAGNWLIQAVRMNNPTIVNEAYIKNLNVLSGLLIQKFSFFATNNVQIKQPLETMQKEQDEMMQKNRENQERLLDVVNSL